MLNNLLEALKGIFEGALGINPNPLRLSPRTEYKSKSRCPKCGSEKVSVEYSFDSDNIRTAGTYCENCGLVD